MSTTDEGKFISRNTKARFVRRPASAPAEAQSGPSLIGKAKSEPTTDRARQIAGTLPEWEPLPPGEIAVRRK